MPVPAPEPLDSPLTPRPLLAHPTLILEWRRFTTRVGLLQRWWLRRHRSFQPLFLLTTPGCGEEAVAHCLNQHPQISLLGEVLSSRYPVGPRRDDFSADGASQHVRFCLQGENAPVRGCTLMLDQIADSRLSLNDLHAAFPGARFIVFYRESLAQQFVSLRRAAGATNGKVYIEEADLRRYCDQTRRLYCDALRHIWLHEHAILLSVEEVNVSSGQDLVSQVAGLLSRDLAQSQIRFCRPTSAPLAESVANYRELQTLLHSPLCRQRYELHGQVAGRRAA